MKRLIDVLRDEHRVIRRAAACLDRLVDHAVDTDDLCVVSALELLEFFEDFADRTHQEKEERHLFPALLATGLATRNVRALLQEHSDERETLERMRDDLEGAAYGDSMSQDRFVVAAARYATLQREHALAEDELLLPLVTEYLDLEAEREVLTGFAEAEAELLRQPSRYYVELVERIAARLGSSVPRGSLNLVTVA